MEYEDVLKMMEDMFSPDVRVILDKDDRILACEAITKQGAEYLSKHAILDKIYDEINIEDLTFESIQ